MLERVKPPPCDTPEGCPKGHWSDPVEIRVKDIPLTRLYDYVRVSGGQCLSEFQKSDEATLWALSRIDDVMRAAERSATSLGLQAAVVKAVSLASVKR